MKFLVTLLFGVASAAVVSQRQDDENDIDITKTCEDFGGTWSSQTRGVLVTWSETVDIFAAIVGKFNMQPGEYIVHAFDSDCNHVNSANLERQNPGFSAHDFDLGGVSTRVDVNCFNTACGDGTTVGDIRVHVGGASMLTSCEEESWAEGIGRYAYRFCSVLA